MSKKIMFHLEQLCLRGTTTATRDMAYWFKKLNPESDTFIIYQTDGPWPNEPAVQEELKNQNINLIPYSVEHDDLPSIVRKINPSHFYRLYHGTDVSKFPPSGMPEFLHAIFMHPDPNTSAYISRWMAREMEEQYGLDKPYLNHIVCLPEPEKNARTDIRALCGIPDDAFVFGRIGGFETFDIPHVREVINNVVSEYKHIYFLFVNTDPKGFIDSDRILFLDKIVNLQEKSNYISACDAMIHARHRGETFGIACAEFLGQRKPILTWGGSRERAHLNHIDKLRAVGRMIYQHDSYIKDMLLDIVDNPIVIGDELDDVLIEFSPEQVIEKFMKLIKY